MVQIKVFAICLASVFVLNFVNCADNELNVESTSVRNITQFLIANPKLKLIQNLTQVKNPQVKDLKFYNFGKRIFDDRLIGQARSDDQWANPRNVRFDLTHQRGETISYVEIHVEQSSNQGRAYIVSGGIGQRSIKIVLEIEQTVYVHLSFVVYGY